MTSAADEFIQRSREYLTREYLPKIRACVDVLSYEDLWWRPNPGSNSIGNLVLHLGGNARQWVVSGICQEPDVRDRAREFEEAERPDGPHLIAGLEAALAEVDHALGTLSPAEMHEPREIQSLPTTVMGALYHVVEHFSMHTGQIIYITKLRTGRDLRFYDVDPAGNVRTNW
jgi:uncharacterized damage-inducible protein DinB